MSTLAYASLQTSQDRAPSAPPSTSGAPGVKTYVNALSALVPAEVLGLHAVIITATTTTVDGATEISAKGTLFWSFIGLAVLSIGLYVGSRFVAKAWNKWDWVRMFIPPLAFVAWTMLQRVTAFDAVVPNWTEAPRTVTALFLGVALGAVAAVLSYKADPQRR